MPFTRISAALASVLLVTAVGCESSNKTITPVNRTARPAVKIDVTSAGNPTSRAGRGEPSLDDHFRQAAWIFVDGQAGTFVEKNGDPQVSWIIEKPVSSTPTIRVEAYAPLLGTPRDFAAVLYRMKEGGATTGPSYAIRANDGRLEIGREFSLLTPGHDFSIRNLATGDVVAEIAPLSPGTYRIVAGVKNLSMAVEGLAVTQFTVGEAG